MRRSVQLVTIVALVSALSGALACNRRVFQEAKNSCDRTLANDIEVPTEKAADILIVVDNSGSMAEEQENLAANFLNKDAAECPLQELDNIPFQYRNPRRDLYTGAGPLARCGFIQLLAAFENDFRVGVITTDVGVCDNRLGSAPAGWGQRPQRGCLQPDNNARKLIAATDLRDGDTANDDFATRFEQTLLNIQTFGSPYERGLDAVALFLDPATERHESCTSDLTTFRRPGAGLVVIFLTDEEDCSHGFGNDAFTDENAGETCEVFNQQQVQDFFVRNQPRRCYSDEATLTSVEPYVDALLRVDPKAKVAVIAGGLGEAGNVRPAGCRVGPQGAPTGGCYESGGSSNLTSPASEPCSPESVAARGGQECCVADPGDRYYRFAELVGQKTTDSICNASFRSTMLDIAAFIAAVDFVELVEPPANPDLVLVEVTRNTTGETETVPRLRAGADCATSTGWTLENDVRVVLCGGARPGPGDQVSVRAAATQAEGCVAQ